MNYNNSLSDKSIWPRFPYKGLSYYETEDIPLFTGREKDLSRFAGIIAFYSTQIVILHGKTGCGKTSFLRANVIPFLETDEHGFQFLRTDEIKKTKPLFIRSTSNPLVSLAESLFDFMSEGFEIKTPLGIKPLNFSEAFLGHKKSERKAFIESVSKSPDLSLKLLIKLATILPRTLVILIDQAEEVLTLNPEQENNKSRTKFFEFISLVSKAEIDIKILIILRTEYYGQFHDAMRGHNLNEKTISDYYLAELNQENLIKAIIRPTSQEDYQGHGCPRDHYRFAYGPSLPRKIAQDLKKEIPLGGLLPAMQIVCERLYSKKKEIVQNEIIQNKKSWTITEKDYEQLGGVKGQVEAYLDNVLKSFCKNIGIDPLQIGLEVHQWKNVLLMLAKIQSDGTVTTELKTEEDLKTAAHEEKCISDFKKVMQFLSDDQQRIIRKSEVINVDTGMSVLHYSLGHDAIGLALKNHFTLKNLIKPKTGMARRFFVEIEKKGERYQGIIYHKWTNQPLFLNNLKLGPDAKVTVKGVPYPLSNLIEALHHHHQEDLKIAYDERGQLELGQYLYQELFSDSDPELLQYLQNDNEKVEVRIITKDEHISRLPWVLLANENGIFLSSIGFSVSLSSRTEYFDYELPPSPRMLLIMPQPEGLIETKAETHLENLEAMLSASDHFYYRGRHLNIVSTWEDFQEQVKRFQPHIIYYYGHAIGDVHSSRLIFATVNRKKRKDISVADFADCLRNLSGTPPLIAYLNCSHGDAGGLMGAGMQLGNFIPAVITNRTVTKTEVAQAQGMSFWRRTLIDGLSPHDAINEIRHDLGGLDLSFWDNRLVTPLLYCHYDRWKMNPPEQISLLAHDPYWHLKLDRVNQFAHVYYLTDRMLKERKPRTLAYVWYGTEGQGVDLFHHRLKVELQEKLTNTYLYEIRPEWPIEFHNPYQSFEDMMKETFNVQTLDHIPTCIRSYSRGQTQRQTLLYIRHSPLRSTKVITLNRLKTYLEWWDCHFTPLLRSQSFALLGISFVVGNPGKFHKTLTEKKRINDLQLHDTVFNLLDEMDQLAKKDLQDFLKAHNIRLPRKYQDKVLEEILEETGGQYEMTLEALKDIVTRAWDFSDEDEEGDEYEDEEDDFGIDD